MSKLETMAYKMQPAGHEKPKPRRKYSGPDRRLAQAFEKWLNNEMSWFDPEGLLDLAKKGLKKIDATADELHSLVFKYQDHPNIRYASPFLSAAYSNQTENIFDINYPLEYVGCLLERDKVLVVLSPTKEYLGQKSEGAILNYGSTHWNAANQNKGLLINYGEAKDQFGEYTSGITINLGKVVNYPITKVTGYVINYNGQFDARKKLIEELFADKKGTLKKEWKLYERRNLVLDYTLNHKNNAMPGLWDYLQGLKAKLEPGKNDYKKAIEVIDGFGKEPAKKIKKDINEIFKRSSYEIA